MYNLVITGGNSEYFDYLKVFVESIRKYNDDTKVVVCDNSIKGTWNNPGTFRTGHSFTNEQRDFFKNNDVEVVIFSELLKKANISSESFNKIKTGHWAYPAKYIYCYLIAKSIGEEVEKVAFFDADVYFQENVATIFSKIIDNFLYINHEDALIKDSDYMKEWIEFSKKGILSPDLDLINIENARIFCTGFFAGKKDVFLQTTNLAFLLSTNQVLPFHNDQPLMNILIYTYGLPYQELGDSVIHLAHIEKENVAFTDNKDFLVNQQKPVAIHYHGKLRDFIKSKLFKDFRPFEPSLREKIKHRISKSFKH